MLTDLAVTGKPAQFGRGVMQDVSDKLLGQFVACLEQRLGGDAPAAPTTDVAAEPAAPDPAPVPAPDADAGAAPPPAAGARHHLRPPPPPRPAASPAKADDAINLGSTVLPILVKTYWKQGLAALAVIVVIIVLIVAL